jgi:hypothetical protein
VTHIPAARRARRLLQSYCGGHLRPLLPNETALEILTYVQVRSGFCAPHLPTEALQLTILATLFNSLLAARAMC